jgi:cytochrome c biogenesis protein CcmG, thiol:disulfide interchange protein DsbE
MPAEKVAVKFLLFLVLGVATGTGLANVRYGAPPPDFQIETRHGLQSLSQLRGTPVVINFWASWCPPCTDELPYFERIKAMYGERVHIITVDWNEDPDAAAQYLRSQHLDLPVVSDRQSKIYAAYSLSEVPDTVVLDASGNVSYVSVGGLSWPELTAAVERVLR